MITSPEHPLPHGGDLAEIRRLYPEAPEPFIDLSTGINPHHYPIPAMGADLFCRLPAPDHVARVARAAASAYGAPSADHVVVAPGTQILLPMIAGLAAVGRTRILGPTYAEHARAARLAGHDVEEVSGVEDLAGADLAVIVNPNNPDGRLLPHDQVRELARQMERRGALLVVDEAFMDVAESDESIAGAGLGVVLRSFGKFHGLAGVRLGFAIANPHRASMLRARLGPWSASGPALYLGEAALADTVWRDAMRRRLALDAARLDRMLVSSGVQVVGGTSLFRLVRGGACAALFHRLARAGILVRRFADRANDLRFGLPPNEPAWERLAAALATAPADA